MTNPTSPAAPPTAAPVDPRPDWTRVFDLAGQVIAQVRPDQLTLPTPCDEYDVHGMLTHLRMVAARVDHIGRGLDPMAVDEGAFRDLDWRAEWRATGASIARGWADDAVLARSVVLPWATLPGAGALAMYVSELLTHTWDLAAATGQRPEYPDAIAEASLALMQQALTADMRTDEVPFGPVVDTAADAPAIDRLVAWTGRDPRWAARA